MNIEDCKVGMKVECTTNEPRGTEYYGSPLKQGDILTISAIKSDYDGVNFEEEKANGCLWYPEDFEPANKFEVGDEVIWQNDKVKIWGIRYDDEVNMYEYAIEDNKDNCGRTIVFEGELSPLKKPDELEVGDKFIAFTDRKLEVLGVHYDDYREEKVYTAKNINDESCCCGEVSIYRAKSVEEIIYD